MSDHSTDALTTAISARLLAIDGVRGLFSPRDPIGLARALDRPAARTVRVDASGPTLRISARIATERSVAAREVVVSIASAVDEVLDEREYDLELEIAVIE